MSVSAERTGVVLSGIEWALFVPVSDSEERKGQTDRRLSDKGCDTTGERFMP